MAKPKSPLLSLGARGTIAEALTFQKRGTGHIAREKPIPTYRYTLAQAYQRWLYEDYAYLWRQQTPSTRQEYASDGVRHHLTGFQYWMKYQLTNLPDILGWWKLDDNVGATTTDSSRNGYTATVFGASPSPGWIDECFSFDGLNDYLDMLNRPAFNFGSAQDFTIEFLFSTSDNAKWLLTKRGGLAAGGWGLRVALGRLFANYDNALGGGDQLDAGIVVNDGLLHHAAFTLDRSTGSILYLNGVAVDTGINPGVDLDNALPLVVGCASNIIFHITAVVDNVILYNRVEDPTEVLRHSLRRYPA